MVDTTDAPGPLTGIRVIDLANERAELAGRVLADLGAEVIKVEPPGGAGARRLPPFEQGRAGDLEGSLYWAAVALGKRSVVLDVGDPADRERLRGLARDADVLIESFDPGMMVSVGLGYDDLRALNPALVYVSVTPYGQTGPAALTPATELTLEAAGGLLGLQGDSDRPPIPVGYPQAAFHAGAQAAADTVIALCERQRSGCGQHLDVSTQAAVVWTLMNATGYPPNTGGDPPRTGEHRTDSPPEPVPGVRTQIVWPCADGYVQASLGLGALGARSLDRLMRRLEQAGEVPDDLHGISWGEWPLDVREGRMASELVNRALAVVAEGFTRRTKRELLDWALTDRYLLAPINSVADVRADPQLAARDYWQEVGGRQHPGTFARLSRTPVRLDGPAPALGEGQTLLDQPRPATATRRRSGGSRGRSVFEGLKVADFAWVGVGPMTSKALADHGATVVHIESTARPDVLRQAGPFKDGEQGLDRSQFMANFNSSKLGLALDLGKDEGRALARRLIDWADVVVESFTPGTMARWGLDYTSVQRPDLVMLSTCLRGQTGPERHYGGFGGQGAALAGFHGITGWPDRPPAGPWGAYTDFIAPRYAVAALASALYHKARTGEGQHIDLSQVEAALHFVEPLLLDYTVNGRVAGPAGHDSDRACPHGVYPTAGVERYIAIAVETPVQWAALRALAPLDGFTDPALDALAARQAQREAIDAALRSWTCGQEPWELAARLQAAGVPASVVLRPSDLYKDPQLAHRGFFVTLEHSVMGPTPYDGPVTRFSATPAVLCRPGPCLGEHTEYVLTEFLGLSPEQVAEYAAVGALS